MISLAFAAVTAGIMAVAAAAVMMAWVTAGIAAWFDLMRTHRLKDGKYECHSACFAADASYAPGLRSRGRILIADGGNEIQTVAGYSKCSRITAGDLSSGNSFSGLLFSYFYIEIFFLAWTYCKKFLDRNYDTAGSVRCVSQFYSVLSHGKILNPL